MPRYIDAKKLKDDIRRFWHPTEQRFIILADIDNTPTENVREATHGTWEKTKFDFIRKCSCCGNDAPVGYRPWWKYCPNCGAEMEEKDNAEIH